MRFPGSLLVFNLVSEAQRTIAERIKKEPRKRTHEMNVLMDIHTPWLDLFGYPLSALEFISTLLGIWAYIEIIRRKARGLVLGFFAAALFAIIFYQCRLYSDLFLMFYYAIASLLGALLWKRRFNRQKTICVERMCLRHRLFLFTLIPLASLIIAWISGHLHCWFSSAFPEPARIPLGDAFTTVCGVSASILIMQRKIEALFLWLLADLVSTGIYCASGIYFLSVLYTVYVLMDGIGSLEWSRRLTLQKENP